MVEAEIVAREGEIVTCPNGHRLFKLTRNAIRRRPILAEDFEAIHPNMPVPRRNEKIHPCPECKELFYRINEYWRAQLHFENGGWR